MQKLIGRYAYYAIVGIAVGLLAFGNSEIVRSFW